MTDVTRLNEIWGDDSENRVPYLLAVAGYTFK